MAILADTRPDVIVGVDTHRDTHMAAVLDPLGRVLATREFRADRGGYDELLVWTSGYGNVDSVGIEGTGAWGKGLTRYLTGNGVETVEVGRPNRQHRRRYGKSDTSDAIGAARAVLSGEASAPPRDSTGPIEALRQLRLVRRSAVKARTQTINQIHSLLPTVPDELRARLKSLSRSQMIETCAGFRPGALANPGQVAKYALRSLAHRYNQLTEEITDLNNQIRPLVETTAPPGLLDLCGVGPNTAADLLIAAGTNPDRIKTAAAFAALCGVSPVDASSGRQQRHRLNRGGDRQANAALYRIVIVRLRYHQPTINYMKRRLAEGLNKPEIIRILKHYVSREIHLTLTKNPT